MLLPKLSCVCIPCFKSVALRVCLVKIPFSAFFFWPNIKAEIGVIIVDSEYGFMSPTP